MPRQLRVFLCHASQDKPAVRELYKRLKAEDWIDPWLDEEKLSFGQHWTTAIEDALSEADVVIIFLSKNSVQKEGFVQRELNYAWELSLEKPRNVIFLIPFRLDDCQIPRYLGSRQWGDYFGDKKENTYQILLRSLKQRHQQRLKLEDAENAEWEQGDHKGTIAESVKKIDANLADKEAEREQFSREKVNNEVAQEVLLASAQQEEKGGISKIEVKRQNKNIRLVGFIWSIILLLVLGGIGLDSIFSQPPEVKTTTPTYKITQTPKPLTETSIPKVFTATIEPTPTLGIGSTMISKKDGMVMVYVPAGEFTMGSDSNSDEQPTSQVNLDAFWIDQTEVTNVMYAQCVKNGGCTIPSSEKSFSHNSYYGNPEFDNYPVIYVNWNQAKDYCSWVGRKLPSEAEWEKAARGTDRKTYPWGEGIDCDISNFNYKCFGDTTKVGNYLDGASLYGAVDMAGNVWEWVSSLYLPYPYDEKDGREDLTASGSRALRGGSWSFNVIHARSANRNENDPIITDDDIGFRCSLSQP